MLRILPLSVLLLVCSSSWTMADTCRSVVGGMVILTNACRQNQNTQRTQHWQELVNNQAVVFYSRLRAAKNRKTVKKETKIADTKTGKLSYSYAIHQAAHRENVDPRLIQAVIQVESGGDPAAVSSAGATGLMQIMPGTAMELDIDPLNPLENIAGGTTYLSHMITRFDKLELALAAYNAGPGSVIRYGGIPPYPETIKYVNNVLETYKLLKKIN